MTIASPGIIKSAYPSDDSVYRTEVRQEGLVEMQILTNPPGQFAGKYIRLAVTTDRTGARSACEVLIECGEAMEMGVLLAALARDASLEQDYESESRQVAQQGAL